MSYYASEQNGTWTVAKLPPEMTLLGSKNISYSLYLKLKDAPHEAPKYLVREEHGEIVTVDQSEPRAHS